MPLLRTLRLARCSRAYSSASSAPSASSSAPTKTIPFPHPLHVGTDLCSTVRIHRLLLKSPARFIRRVLTPRELRELPPVPSADAMPIIMAPRTAISYLASAETMPSNLAKGAEQEEGPLWSAATHLAGRFAAKEAAIKAHPHIPSLTLQSIRIGRSHDATEHRNNSGPPIAYITLPPAAEGDAPTEQEARLSISHDGKYATAVCIGFES
ncbi:4 -phosphopantetheinyl transferase superfamily protein [Ophiostoma piceae UAMH 11346]|uniref:4-phosphopantetheinyl transferase superfamily protein n=1 Tax=Ophiostoma piceae (strain UAMH 11346) TaxID=1262450 RepID=S3CNV3_OPHP1|nr:4 -phosphopantetheinyl transferase superfamily protein [Ophiostoma piceae UAMH 11346]